MRQNVEGRQRPPSVMRALTCLLNAASACHQFNAADQPILEMLQLQGFGFQFRALGKNRQPARLALSYAREDSSWSSGAL
jgi:hypothetical protein